MGKGRELEGWVVEGVGVGVGKLGGGVGKCCGDFAG